MYTVSVAMVTASATRSSLMSDLVYKMYFIITLYNLSKGGRRVWKVFKSLWNPGTDSICISQSPTKMKDPHRPKLLLLTCCWPAERLWCCPTIVCSKKSAHSKCLFWPVTASDCCYQSLTASWKGSRQRQMSVKPSLWNLREGLRLSDADHQRPKQALWLDRLQRSRPAADWLSRWVEAGGPNRWQTLQAGS